MLMPHIKETLKDKQLIFLNTDMFQIKNKRQKYELFSDVIVDMFKDENIFTQMHVLNTLHPFLQKLPLSTFNQLCNHIKNTIQKHKVPDGDMVGIVAAQSISERFTQTTLNSFHIAGSKTAAAQMGITRVVELLDALKLLKQPIISNIQSKYTENFFEHTLANSSHSYGIKYDYNTEFSPYQYFFHINREFVVFALMATNKFQIDKDGVIHFEAMKVSWKYYKDKKHLVGRVNKKFILSIVKTKFNYVSNKKICGATCEDIENDTVFFKHGTLLHKNLTLNDIFFAMPDVDLTKIIPNDIHFIAQNFGIEAARTYLVREIPHVLAQEGIYINYRHITLLVDNMTSDGFIRPNKFSGVKDSIFLKATFEQATKTFANAAGLQKTDPLQNVSAQIILGKLTNLGSNQSKIISKETPVQLPTEYPTQPPESPTYFPASPIYEDTTTDIIEPTFFV